MYDVYIEAKLLNYTYNALNLSGGKRTHKMSSSKQRIDIINWLRHWRFVEYTQHFQSDTNTYELRRYIYTTNNRHTTANDTKVGTSCEKCVFTVKNRHSCHFNNSVTQTPYPPCCVTITTTIKVNVNLQNTTLCRSPQQIIVQKWLFNILFKHIQTVNESKIISRTKHEKSVKEITSKFF